MLYPGTTLVPWAVLPSARYDLQMRRPMLWSRWCERHFGQRRLPGPVDSNARWQPRQQRLRSSPVRGLVRCGLFALKLTMPGSYKSRFTRTPASSRMSMKSHIIWPVIHVFVERWRTQARAFPCVLHRLRCRQ